MVCNTVSAWWLLIVIRRHPQARPAPIELRLTPNWCGTRLRLELIKLDVIE